MKRTLEYIEHPVIDKLKKDNIHLFLQTVSNSYLYGGYLRDCCLQIKPNDIDIKTSLSISELKEKIKIFSERDTINQLTVYNSRYNEYNVEISLIDTYEHFFEEQYNTVTINTLLFNGSQLIDNLNALEDFRQKIIRADKPEKVLNSSKENPISLFKTIRLLSYDNFTLDDAILAIYIKKSDLFSTISSSIKNNEFYKILYHNHTLNSFYYLSKAHLIHDIGLSKAELERLEYPLHKKTLKIHFLLCYYALVLKNVDVINDLIKIFELPAAVQFEFNRLYSYYFSNEESTNPILKQQKFLLTHILKKLDEN